MRIIPVLYACKEKPNKRRGVSILHLILQAGAKPNRADCTGRTLVNYLREYQPYSRAIIVVLEQGPEAEKASFLVKTRRLVVAAAGNATAPSYLRSRVARGLPLPHVELASVPGCNKKTRERRRQFSITMAFLVGMGVGPKGASMQKDVFRVVLDFIMPIWDPLRLGIAGETPLWARRELDWSPLQGEDEEGEC